MDLDHKTPDQQAAEQLAAEAKASGDVEAVQIATEWQVEADAVRTDAISEMPDVVTGELAPDGTLLTKGEADDIRQRRELGSSFIAIISLFFVRFI